MRDGRSLRHGARSLPGTVSESNCIQIRSRLPDEDEVRTDIIDKACSYGRAGCLMVTAMMRNEGRKNRKRVERIWREEGLKLPEKQEKKRRLWLNDGSVQYNISLNADDMQYFTSN